MTETLFRNAFWLAAPFWALLILAPRWSWTPRIFTSPWVTLLPLGVYFVLLAPHLGAFWHLMTQPNLDELRAFLGQPDGTAVVWAHLVAFDLFIARWMYFEARDRSIPALLVSPILLLTIFLSPFGLVAFLLVREAYRPFTPARRADSRTL